MISVGLIVGMGQPLFALKWCSCVSKFEHDQAQPMGIGAAISGRPVRAASVTSEPRSKAAPTGSGRRQNMQRGCHTSLDSPGNPR